MFTIVTWVWLGAVAGLVCLILSYRVLGNLARTGESYINAIAEREKELVKANTNLEERLRKLSVLEERLEARLDGARHNVQLAPERRSEVVGSVVYPRPQDSREPVNAFADDINQDV